ncbi:cyclic peptide export ABC transporter [Candidatus Nitrospira bockiana]
MHLIVFLLRRSWRLLLLAGLAGLISGLSGAGLIALVHTGLSATDGALATLVWGFAGLCLLVPVSRVVSEVLLTRLGQAAIAELRMQLSRQIVNAPLRHLQELGSPRLLATLTEDVSSIAQAFVELPMLCINVATVIGCLLYLAWLSWPLLGVVLGVMAVGVGSFQVHQRRALESLRLARETNDALYQRFRALTEGIKELKLHRRRRDAFVSQILQPTVTTYRRHVVDGMSRYAAASSWGGLLFYAVIGLLLFAPLRWPSASVDTVTGYLLVLLYMMAPLERIVDMVPGLARAGIALKKVEAIGLSLASHDTECDTVPRDACAIETNGRPLVGRAAPGWTRLELVELSHRYHRESEDHAFRLGPISLTFHPGELTFLIGGNGSGKTTLALLLIGLYRPEGGEIRLDGQVITDANRDQYRQLFSVVFSDFYLFEGLVGLSAAQLDAQAREYLVRLQLHHKVQVRDGVLSTLALSQGQRKRLALLTAYLEDRPFYVFDEWAADQDPLFRKVFYTQLLPDLKAKGKTVLVITHDDQYFGVADRCIRMDVGRVTEVTRQAAVLS